jgi:hypothetical protein
MGGRFAIVGSVQQNYSLIHKRLRYALSKWLLWLDDCSGWTHERLDEQGLYR